MEEHKIEHIGTYAISIGTAIIIVAIISILLQSMKDDTSIVPDQRNSLVDNQSLTWGGNNTAISLSESRIDTGTFVLYNNGSIVNQGSGDNANYTVTGSSVTIINTSGTGNVGGPKGVNGSDWVTNRLNASFDYFYGSSARNATDQGLEGQTTFASFFTLIALALAGALVIGITIRYFSMKREND